MSGDHVAPYNYYDTQSSGSSSPSASFGGPDGGSGPSGGPGTSSGGPFCLIRLQVGTGQQRTTNTAGLTYWVSDLSAPLSAGYSTLLRRLGAAPSANDEIPGLPAPAAAPGDLTADAGSSTADEPGRRSARQVGQHRSSATLVHHPTATHCHPTATSLPPYVVLPWYCPPPSLA